jgi:hypothetical protein
VTTNPVTLMLTASPGAAIGYFSFVVTAAGDGLTSSQRAIVLVQARTTGCSRFSLLPTRCKPPIRTPIRLSDSP